MNKKALTVAALTAFTASMAHAELIADSVADFGAQDTNGWSYGHYDSDDNFQTVDWAQMQEFDGGWRVQSANYWTGVWSELMHPNAGGTDKNDSIQSAARRWTSTVDGQVSISGLIAHQTHHIVMGDGTTARILVNGQEVYSYDVAADDTVGVNYDISLNLSINDVVDFVLSAGDSNDVIGDATFFTVSIVPAPSSLALLGAAGLAFRRRR